MAAKFREALWKAKIRKYNCQKITDYIPIIFRYEKGNVGESYCHEGKALARPYPRASARQFPICFLHSPAAWYLFSQVLWYTTLAHNREAGASPTFDDSDLSVCCPKHGLFKTPEWVHFSLTNHLAFSGVSTIIRYHEINLEWTAGWHTRAIGRGFFCASLQFNLLD